MCRIFGFLKKDSCFVSKIQIEKAQKVQINGGPDVQSLHRIHENACIANNRLSLQDIELGNQPFIFDDIHVVFNGEIYNHYEIRTELSKKGYRLKTNCDGEVIPYLYKEYGLDFPRYLDGMFAIALFDSKEKKMILVNDHLAIKSLYFFLNHEIFCFSSDIKGISCFLKEKPRFRGELIDNYLVGRAIWGNETFFENILVMKPSEMIIVNENLEKESFHYESMIKSEYIPFNFEDSASFLNFQLENEISKMMKTDEKSCVVLSGGLDSSYIAALMKRKTDFLETFHVCYDFEWNNDERKYAKFVAETIGANHHEIVISSSKMLDLLFDMVKNLGVPNTAPHALAAFELYKQISNSGYKIAFAGEGSDEIFCGYKRFSSAIFDVDKNWVEKYFSLFSINSLKEIRKYYRNQINFDNSYDKKLENLLQGCCSPQSRLKKLLEIERIERFPNYILRRVDHLSMSSALEIRVPFCQKKIFDFGKNLPLQFKVEKNQEKCILFKAASQIVPKKILERKKWPFTMPLLEMFDENIKNKLIEILKENNFLKDYFNLDLILNDLMFSNEKKTLETIWAILILGIWVEENV